MHMPRVTLLRKPAHSGWLQGVATGIGLHHPVYSPSAAAEHWQWSSLLNANDYQSVQRDKPLP